MYDELLRIKAYREDTAATRVKREQRLVAERTRSLQQAQDDFAQFRNHRVERELALFEDIRERPVALRAVEDMNLQVALLREKEAAMAEQIEVARQQLSEARKKLEKAREHHQEAIREHVKFLQFIEVHKEDERREQARREENELEESASAGQYTRTMVE